MSSARSLGSHWQAAARLIAESRDVLDARPRPGGDEPALVARGWASFLLALDDAQLTAIEVRGHAATWPEDTPATLAAFVAEARAVCAMPPLAPPEGAPDAPPRAARRRETPRKRVQVDAFVALVTPLAARATRVVDVGSGHGHLTRELAERIGRPVVGLERDVAVVERARALPSSGAPSFAVIDVLRDGLALATGDCVIGLHACGELGDAIVESVARAGNSVALVGCCLQKRRASSRSPLCSAPGLDDAIELPRGLLGLSNLTARDEGVEASLADNLAARERRFALARLVAADGARWSGTHVEGISRRAAHGDLAALVARAFARRGRPCPSPAAIEEAAAWARGEQARVRRLSLPRSLLARALEVLVLHDRALYLEQRGFAVSVGTLFPDPVSARNLALVGYRLG